MRNGQNGHISAHFSSLCSNFQETRVFLKNCTMRPYFNNHPEIFAKLQNRQMDKPLQSLFNFIICSFKTCSQLSKINQIVINHKQSETFLFLFKTILLIENRNIKHCK